MNTVTLTRHPNIAPADGGLMNAAALIARRIRKTLRTRSDRHLLESMPDHILADIGLSRSGIDRAVKYGRMYDGRR